MDKQNYIISSDVAADSYSVGGKAAALAKLRGKFTIPEWFVVAPQAFLDSVPPLQQEALNAATHSGEIHVSQAVAQAIAAATSALVQSNKDGLFAVRSSATAEDGEHASFAGQLESFLNVPASEVVERVRDVWYSAFAERVSYYRKTVAYPNGWAPAVIVQRMVKAETAGVAFSADPVTGNHHSCIINATHGLADRLVSGEVSGDTYYLTRNAVLKKQTLCGESAVLNQRSFSRIIEVLLKVEQHFGIPQDIEWAIEGEELYLLQARPITSLAHQPIIGKGITVWDNSNIVESYSGVTSPLTFSFARYVYEHVYIEFCKFMGVSRGKVEHESDAFRTMLGFVNGHVYYNLLSWYRVLALFPGFTMNRKFMEQMMGVKEPLPEEILANIIRNAPSWREKVADAMNVIRTLTGLFWHQITLRKTTRHFYDRLNDAVSTVEPLEHLSLEQLAKAYRNLEGKLLKKWDAPLINDFLCMIAFGLSRKLLETYAGSKGLSLHNDIMIGQGDIISAEPAIRIRAMALVIRDNEGVIERLIKGDVTAIGENAELQRLYQDYLKKFGDRCLQELKLESPTLHDDPTMLLQAIGHMARRKLPAEAMAKQGELDMALLTLLRNNPRKKWVISHLVKWAKARVRDRENLRFERTRVFGRVRAIFIEIGKRLHALHYIDEVRDIFFLEVNEIMAFIEGAGTTYELAALITIRKKQHEAFNTQAAPPNRFETYGASCYSFKAQFYHSEASATMVDGESVTGIGCCQGIVTAAVRVIHNPREAELRAGEIMVAQFTDPGWITLFANASGILVERGSLLSHSAIVAREMGIPAIVAIDGVMGWLKTGDVVEMNGATGMVRKIKDAGNKDEE